MLGGLSARRWRRMISSVAMMRASGEHHDQQNHPRERDPIPRNQHVLFSRRTSLNEVHFLWRCSHSAAPSRNAKPVTSITLSYDPYVTQTTSAAPTTARTDGAIVRLRAALKATSRALATASATIVAAQAWSLTASVTPNSDSAAITPSVP